MGIVRAAGCYWCMLTCMAACAPISTQTIFSVAPQQLQPKQRMEKGSFKLAKALLAFFSLTTAGEHTMVSLQVSVPFS